MKFVLFLCECCWRCAVFVRSFVEIDMFLFTFCMGLCGCCAICVGLSLLWGLCCGCAIFLRFVVRSLWGAIFVVFLLRCVVWFV